VYLGVNDLGADYKVHKIENFYENGVNMGFGKCFKFVEIEPIPLTEEWLLNLGFNYDDMEDTNENDNLWYHLVYGDFRFSSDKSINFESVFIRLNKTNLEIKYVHQLQNLYFALTGKELDYDPNR
jgi:hypothetical protein